MTMTKSANIIDKPRPEGGRDLLGTDKYMEALNRYILNANMPTTIAIQGEWGSGKTSMMNQMKHSLCESEGNPGGVFHSVWVNTWQYSLMKSPDETLVAIIEGLTEHVLGIIQSKHKTKADQIAKKIGSALAVVAKAAAKTAVSQTGIDGGEVVDGIVSDGAEGKTILGLRNSLEDAIDQCLRLDSAAGNEMKGFLFFVDDLDRIDPPIAVQILELVKNIFEVTNCIFVLAIDYDVVVKGLEPKFGPLTEKNEREFRSFFDKIIQLPFSMPLGSYSVDDFLIESLTEVGYLDEELKSEEEFKASITQMAMTSVGNNPRSIKRLINTISLIQIMNDLQEGDFGESKVERLINFGLVCLQIAYPTFYELINEEPNYLEWNDKVARRLQLRDLSDEEKQQLDATVEFDEDWEKIVYRCAIKDPYLKSKAFSISNLLNLIKEAAPNKDGFGELIESTLTLSSVTSVNADKKGREKPVGQRDYTKFKFKGQELTKGRLVLEVVRQYVADHPDVTFEQLEVVFPKQLQGSLGVFMTKDDAVDRAEKTGHKRHFIKDSEIIRLKDSEIAICTQWGTNNIPRAIEIFKGLGYQ